MFIELFGLWFYVFGIRIAFAFKYNTLIRIILSTFGFLHSIEFSGLNEIRFLLGVRIWVRDAISFDIEQKIVKIPKLHKPIN